MAKFGFLPSMRRVDRHDVDIPRILSSAIAQRAYADLVAEIDLNAPDRSRRIPIDYSLVRHPEVRDALYRLFRGKCAYCESVVQEVTVDHFRPFSAASDAGERKTSLLHYSWLAYEWRNLYQACGACNANKRNRFPVKGRRAPVLFALDEIREREDALLVDPCFDNPDLAFDFTFDGHCIGRTEKGQASVAILDLDRLPLVEARARTFADAVSFARQGDSFLLFNPDRPHAGALETFARRMSAILADRLDIPRPARGAQLEMFSSLVAMTPEDELQDLLRAPAGEAALRADAARAAVRPPIAPSQETSAVWGAERLDRAIARIEIENFKGVDHLVLDVPELADRSKAAGCLMLLADNGAGKTSVLQAVALAVMGPERVSKLKLDRERLIRNGDPTRWGQRRKSPARIGVHFHSGERAWLELDPLTLEFSGRGGPADSLMAYGAHRLLGERKRRGRAATARVASLFDSGAPVSHPDAWLANSATDFETVARALAEVLVLQSKDALVRDELGDIFVQSYGQLTPIDALSDGYRSVIAMAVDTIRWLLQDWPDLETARGVVLIDEIDAHLHPRWKLQIMGALRRAMPQVQFIATTHDPLCLRGMGQGEVVVMKRSFEQSFDLITDLPDFRGMSAEQLLMSDYFGLSSTAAPEIEVGLSQMADRIGEVGLERRIRADTDEAFASLMLGDTPQRQVADTAMLEYLRRRRDGTGEAVSEGRRRAIDAVLAAIRAGDGPA